MQTYSKLLSEIICSKKVVSAEIVWKELCLEYCSTTSNQNSFFQSRADYIEVANLFCNAAAMPALFTEILNRHFQSVEMDMSGNFSQMLQAFLTCFPQYLDTLHINITRNLNIKPYRLPLTENDLEQILANKSSADDLTHTVKIIPWLFDYFTKEQFDRAIVLIAEAFLSYDCYLSSAVYGLLEEINKINPHVDLTVLITILLEKLKSTEMKVRLMAVTALYHLIKYPFGHDDNVTAILISNLQSDNTQIHNDSFRILLRLASESKGEISSIVLALATCSDSHFYELKHELTSEDSEAKITKLFLRPEIDFTPIIAKLQVSLKTGSEEQIQSAALVIGIIAQRPEIKPDLLIPDILQNLKHEDDNIRESCAISLNRLCKRTDLQYPLIIPALMSMLGDKDSDVIEITADTLSHISTSSNINFIPILDNLLVSLDDASVDIQKGAAYFIGKICEKSGISTEIIINKLLNLLGTNFHTDKAIITALCQISNRSEVDIMTIVKGLIAELPYFSWMDKDMVNHFFGEISSRDDVDPNIIVTALLPLLKHDDPDMSESVINALGKVCNRPEVDLKVYVSALLDAVYINGIEPDCNCHIKNVIISELDTVIANSKNDITAILAYLLTELPSADWVRRELITGALAAAAKRPEIDTTLIMPDILAGLSDEYFMTRKAAINALSSIAKKAGKDIHFSLSPLFHALTDSNHDVKRSAIYALDEIITHQLPLNKSDDDHKAENNIEVEVNTENNSKKRKHYFGYNDSHYYRSRGRGSAGRYISNRAIMPSEEMKESDVGIDYAKLIQQLLPLLEDTGTDIQIAAINTLGKIVCKKYFDGLPVLVSAFAEKIKTADYYAATCIIDIYVEICNTNKIDSLTIIPILAARLNDSKTNTPMVNESLVKAIYDLINDKVSAGDKNYCLYGILLKEFYTARSLSNKLSILEIINKSLHKEYINLQLESHLIPDVANIGEQYWMQ